MWLEAGMTAARDRLGTSRILCSHYCVAYKSSSSTCCPVIWGRRYSWWSCFPCFSLCCVILCQPSLCHTSLARIFPHYVCPPLLVSPGISTSSILLTVYSSFILVTCPYHFCRFSVLFLDTCATLAVPLMCSFRIVSLLVTTHTQLSILISVAYKYFPLLQNIIVLGEANGCLPYSALIQDDGKCFPDNLDWDTQEDIAALPFSSGTAGKPKGVMISHLSLIMNIDQTRFNSFI